MGEIISFKGRSSCRKIPPEEDGREFLDRLERQSLKDIEPFEPVLMSKSEKTDLVLERIEQIRKLAVEGRIEDFIFIARDTETKHFLTEVPTPSCDPVDIFSFVGVLSALKLEMIERSQYAPALLLDGTVSDPMKQERLK